MRIPQRLFRVPWIAAIMVSWYLASCARAPHQLATPSPLPPQEDVTLDALKNLEIYPAIKEVLERDGKVYPGLLQVLQGPVWKAQRVKNSWFFYTEEETFTLASQQMEVDLFRVSQLLGLDTKKLVELRITCFLFPEEFWTQLTVGSSFHLPRTSQIYISQHPGCCGPNASGNLSSAVTHELTHLVIEHEFNDREIPFWVGEGLAIFLDRSWKQDERFDELAQVLPSLVERGKAIPLEDLILLKDYHATGTLQAMESFYVVLWFIRTFGKSPFVDFLHRYLKEGDFPSQADFLAAYRTLSGTDKPMAVLEREFFEFLVRESQTPQRPQRPAAVLRFDPGEMDFGVVTQGDTLRYAFRGINVSQDVALIDEVQTTCGCTVADVQPRSVEPGQPVEVHAVLNTTGKAGRVTERVDLSIQVEQETYHHTLVLRADVTPQTAEQQRTPQVNPTSACTTGCPP